MKKKYTVNGMMCSACSSSVERVVKRIKGVNSVAVNLNSKLLAVECDNQVTDDDVYSYSLGVYQRITDREIQKNQAFKAFSYSFYYNNYYIKLFIYG